MMKQKKPCSKIIQEAYAILKEEHINGKRHYGSCTFNLAKIDLQSGEMEIANIGDSALCVFSSKDLKFSLKTEIKQRFFNCPHQIGIELREQYLDCEKDTYTYYHQLMEDDLIISATDGVWDGLPFDGVESVMSYCKSDLTNACSTIYSKARVGNRKYDDVTIILAKVIKVEA